LQGKSIVPMSSDIKRGKNKRTHLIHSKTASSIPANEISVYP